MVMGRANASAPERQLPLTVFGIAFGSAGLAALWTAAADHDVAPPLVADLLWCVVTLVLVTSLYEYGRRTGGVRHAIADVRDPVRGMYSALVPALVLLLGSRLTRESHLMGHVVVAVAAVVTVVFAALFTIRVLTGLRSRTFGVRTWHGGYLLPTASTPLIASQVLALADMTWPARSALVFGLGWWMVIAAVLAARLVVATSLPPDLRMTLAIAASPPAMAGNAWFALHAGVDDTQIWLMVMVIVTGLMQVVLIPQYARTRFDLGWWSVAFAVTANATYALQWVCVTKPPGWHAEVATCLVVASLTVATIAARSLTSARFISTGLQLRH